MNNFYIDLAAAVSAIVEKPVSVVWVESAVRLLKKSIQLDGLTFEELITRLTDEWRIEFY